MPNPQSGSQLRLALNLEADADALEIRVYTKAMAVIEKREVQGPFNAPWCQVMIQLDQAPASGLYYVIVTGINSEGRETQDGISKVFYLQ